MLLQKMKKTRKAKISGFTGTSIEKTDANSLAVFGDSISIYDIQCAVANRPLCRSITRAASPNWA